MKTYMKKIKGFDLVVMETNSLVAYHEKADLYVGLFDRYMSRILFDKKTKTCFSCRNDYSCEAIDLLNEYLENGVTNMRKINGNEVYGIDEPAIALYRKDNKGFEQSECYILKNKHMSKIEPFTGYKLTVVPRDVIHAIEQYADLSLSVKDNGRYSTTICFFKSTNVCMSSHDDFSSDALKLITEFLENGVKNLKKITLDYFCCQCCKIAIETNEAKFYTLNNDNKSESFIEENDNKMESFIEELKALIVKYGYTNFPSKN